jgi:hypothetical protein
MALRVRLAGLQQNQPVADCSARHLAQPLVRHELVTLAMRWSDRAVQVADRGEMANSLSEFYSSDR